MRKIVCMPFRGLDPFASVYKFYTIFQLDELGRLPSIEFPHSVLELEEIALKRNMLSELAE